MKSFSKTSTAVAITLLLTACATAVPVTMKFPPPPGELVTTACPPLQKLTTPVTLSELSRNITTNYTAYYECAIRVNAWQEWYEIHKKIFEDIK